MMSAEIIQAGSPIKTAIEQARKEVQDGLGDWELKAPLDLEMSVIAKNEGGGKVSFWILSAGANVSNEEIHKIRISMGPISDAEEAEKKARIAKAEYDKTKHLVDRGSLEDRYPNALKRARNGLE